MNDNVPGEIKIVENGVVYFRITIKKDENLEGPNLPETSLSPATVQRLKPDSNVSSVLQKAMVTGMFCSMIMTANGAQLSTPAIQATGQSFTTSYSTANRFISLQKDGRSSVVDSAGSDNNIYKSLSPDSSDKGDVSSQVKPLQNRGDEASMYKFIEKRERIDKQAALFGGAISAVALLSSLITVVPWSVGIPTAFMGASLMVFKRIRSLPRG